MKREILSYPDPRLTEKACVVTEITPELRGLANDMVETMYESQGIGLAATQLGEMVRLVVIDVTGPESRDGLIVMFNPEIVSCSGETESEEGCLSVPNFQSKVQRHQTVTVKGTSLDGQEIAFVADDLLAICFQHEIDHLDGTLFIDRISHLKRTMYDRKVQKWLKKNENNSV